MTVTINGTTGIAGVDGSAGTPAIQGADTNTGMFFPAVDTIAFAEGGVEIARFDSSSNLLVGTTNTPSNKDTVTPKFIVNGAGVAGSMQVVRNTTVGGGGAILGLTATRGTDVNSYTILQSGDGIGSVIFGGADGNEFVQAASIVAQVDGTPGDNDMPGRLVFSTTADGASSVTERMRIDSGGSVLIATTSSTIGGDGGRLLIDAGASSLALLANRTADGNIVRWYRSSTNVGNINVTTTATAYNTSSDYRLKNTIAPMIGALAKVALLKPCTYKWNVDGSDGQGFIAHELNEVVPGCVSGEKDAVETYVDENGNEATRPAYQGIDTSFLVATLTAAIQEQQTLITALTARITALEAK